MRSVVREWVRYYNKETETHLELGRGNVRGFLWCFVPKSFIVSAYVCTYTRTLCISSTIPPPITTCALFMFQLSGPSLQANFSQCQRVMLTMKVVRVCVLFNLYVRM